MASYKVYLQHHNDNHDPKTGQFTFSNASGIAKNARNANNEIKNVVDKFGKTKKQPRVDLSKLSDQELRDILNREEMERRYDTYFNTPTERKGVKYTKDVLDILGALGGIAVAGLSVAGLILGIQAKVKGA